MKPCRHHESHFHAGISWAVLQSGPSIFTAAKRAWPSRRRTHLKPVIGPGPEFHDTCLLVEGKVLNVDLTGRLVNGGRLPLYQPVPPQGGLRGQGHFKITIGAERANPGLVSLKGHLATRACTRKYFYGRN
jgi:hypothetical protein